MRERAVMVGLLTHIGFAQSPGAVHPGPQLVRAASSSPCCATASERPRLVFTPASPRAGDSVLVAYEAPQYLRADSVLVLRAVARAFSELTGNWPEAAVTDLARLHRQADGRYAGAFMFPSNADFLRVAVGTADTLQADSNGGAHWTLLAHASTGQPTADALWIAALDEIGRNDWQRALAIADTFTAMYPELPATWNNRATVERGVLGEGSFARRKADYVNRLVSFDSLHAAPGQPASGDDLGALYWLALSLGDSARAARWRARLLDEAPLHPLAIQERMDDVAIAYRGRAAARLDTLEALYRLAGPGHSMLLRSGIAAARAAKDTAAVRRWTMRASHERLFDTPVAAQQFARVPALLPAAERMLVAALDSLERGLGHRLPGPDATLSDVRRAQPGQQAEILTGMAVVALAMGDSGAALAHYVRAADAKWNPDVFRAAEALARTRGARAIERRMAAMLAADPLSAGATRDSIRARDPRLAADAAWRSFLAAGERDMVKRVHLDPAPAIAATSLRLAPWRTSIARPVSVTRGRATVIALWSMACPYSAPQLPTLAHMDSVLSRRGIRVLVATRDEPSADLDAFVAKQKSAPPVQHDPENTIGRTFSAYGYPWFFVLDSRGRLRARGNDINSVAAAAVAAAIERE